MSALTVRANMRMMFDEGSANRAQAKYMARIAQMEQGASNATGRANQHLLNNHKMLVSQLQKQNKQATSTTLGEVQIQTIQTQTTVPQRKQEEEKALTATEF